MKMTLRVKITKNCVLLPLSFFLYKLHLNFEVYFRVEIFEFLKAKVKTRIFDIAIFRTK